MCRSRADRPGADVTTTSNAAVSSAANAVASRDFKAICIHVFSIMTFPF